MLEKVPRVTSELVQQLSRASPQFVLPGPGGTQLGGVWVTGDAAWPEPAPRALAGGGDGASVTLRGAHASAPHVSTAMR
jgi:hypothetical protein